MRNASLQNLQHWMNCWTTPTECICACRDGLNRRQLASVLVCHALDLDREARPRLGKCEPQFPATACKREQWNETVSCIPTTNIPFFVFERYIIRSKTQIHYFQHPQYRHFQSTRAPMFVPASDTLRRLGRYHPLRKSQHD
jgi:hypothetical protein